MYAPTLAHFIRSVLHTFADRTVGLVQIAADPQDPYPVKTKMVSADTELLAELSRILTTSQDTHNLYFTVAAYKPKATNRTKESVAHCAVLYFDIDDETFDVAQLAAFEEAFGLNPKSKYVVATGGGYHVYYLLSQCYDVATWEKLAHKFYAVAKSFNIPYDPNAKDITRILRIPLSKNHKYTPARYVAILQQADIDQRSDVSQHVSFELPKNILENNKVYNYDANFEYLRDSCAVLRYIISNPDCEYKLWYNMMCNVAHCEDGLTYIHEISSGRMGGVESIKYNARDIDRLFSAYIDKQIGPPTCDVIMAATDNVEVSKLCESCAKRHKIKSPVQRPTDEQPIIPKGFTVDANVCYVTEDETIVVCSPAVVFTHRLYDERKDEECLAGYTKTLLDMEKEVVLRPMEMVETTQMCVALARKGIVVHNQKLMKLYVTAARTILLDYPRQIIYTHLGWRVNQNNLPSEFVLGANKIYRTSEGYVSTMACMFSSNMNNKYIRSIKTVGSFDMWRSALTYYADPKYKLHQFTIGIALASVLMRFTGYNGIVFNIVGKSGVGKTTLQRIVNSFFGDPNALLVPISSVGSTYNAKVEIFSLLNSICISAEEATEMRLDELNNIVFTFSQGMEKHRADIDGTLRVNRPAWHTLMLMSSNVFMQDKLIGAVSDPAKITRMIEYELVTPDQMSLVEFKRYVDDVINENYGHAGPLFIKYVLQHPSQVIDQLKKEIDKIVIEAQCTPAERFKVAACAAIITATDIANKLNIVPWTSKYVRQVAKHVLSVKPHKQYEAACAVDTPKEIIANIIAQYQDRFCFVTYEALSGAVIDKMTHRDGSELWGRVESDGKSVRVFIITSKFKQLMAKQRINYAAMLMAAANAGDIRLLGGGEKRYVRLYKDINKNQLRAWCYGFEYDEVNDDDI